MGPSTGGHTLVERLASGTVRRSDASCATVRLSIVGGTGDLPGHTVGGARHPARRKTLTRPLPVRPANGAASPVDLEADASEGDADNDPALPGGLWSPTAEDGEVEGGVNYDEAATIDN